MSSLVINFYAMQHAYNNFLLLNKITTPGFASAILLDCLQSNFIFDYL